ncbi:Uncharacterised protein [Mycobacteroides abscessus subsp. abscessus]|nr:Uncharacterised protein [Mycobacteroides abscessus subsp. abscessus]
MCTPASRAATVPLPSGRVLARSLSSANSSSKVFTGGDSVTTLPGESYGFAGGRGEHVGVGIPQIAHGKSGQGGGMSAPRTGGHLDMVGHHQDRAARGLRSGCSGHRIFDGQAIAWLDAQ